MMQHDSIMTKRSRGELKRLARECLLGNYPPVMIAMLAAFFLPPILLAPFSAGMTAEFNIAAITYILAAVIIEILGQLLAVSVLRMHMRLAQKQPAAFMDLFWTFRNRPDRFILATFLFYAVLLVPAVIAGVWIYYFLPNGTAAGIMFLIGAGLVFAVLELYLIYTFEMIYPLYIDHPEMTVLEGFEASRKLMRGNKKRLFILQLSFLGWQLLGLCSAGVGFLWIRPYMTQTTANFYLDLTNGFAPADDNLN